MNPKLKQVLARVVLVGGIALVASVVAKGAPHPQTLVVRLGDTEARRLSGVITRVGDSEPTAGFSQDFPGGSPRFVRHRFSAPDDTYIVVITLSPPAPTALTDASEASSPAPIPAETTFERQVSLVGGEVIVSPD